jgi:hypothetical protein
LKKVSTKHSGPSSLAILQNAGNYGVAIQLTKGSTVYQQTNLLAVEVVNDSGVATWLTASYSTAVAVGGAFTDARDPSLRISMPIRRIRLIGYPVNFAAKERGVLLGIEISRLVSSCQSVG